LFTVPASSSLFLLPIPCSCPYSGSRGPRSQLPSQLPLRPPSRLRSQLRFQPSFQLRPPIRFQLPSWLRLQVCFQLRLIFLLNFAFSLLLKFGLTVIPNFVPSIFLPFVPTSLLNFAINLALAFDPNFVYKFAKTSFSTSFSNSIATSFSTSFPNSITTSFSTSPSEPLAVCNLRHSESLQSASPISPDFVAPSIASSIHHPTHSFPALLSSNSQFAVPVALQLLPDIPVNPASHFPRNLHRCLPSRMASFPQSLCRLTRLARAPSRPSKSPPEKISYNLSELGLRIGCSRDFRAALIEAGPYGRITQQSRGTELVGAAIRVSMSAE
jgi:hypothetical protein